VVSIPGRNRKVGHKIMTNLDSKILNIAWVGHGDFGDELMAFALRNFLKATGVQTISYYEAGGLTRYQPSNDLKIRVLHASSTPRKVKQFSDLWSVRGFGALLMGGGSIFHSQNSISWKSTVLQRARRFSPGMFAAMVGVSLGPFRSEEAKKQCAALLSKQDVVILRDKHSYDTGKELLPDGKFFTSFDTSLLLAKELKDKSFVEDFRPPEGDLVALVLIAKSLADQNFLENGRFSKFLSLLNSLIKNGKQVLLASLYGGEEFVDERLNLLLKKRCVDPEKVTLHSFNGDIFATLRELNRAGMIISMRLHGCIAAYMLGIPFISLAFDPKSEWFCDAINYPRELSLPVSWADDLSQVKKAISFVEQNGGKIFENVIAPASAGDKVRENLEIMMKRWEEKV